MKDTLRLFFFISLALSLLVLWQKWEKWQSETVRAPASASAPADAAPAASQTDFANGEGADLPVPSETLTAAGDGDDDAPQIARESEGDARPGGRRVTVDNGWFTAELGENGGDILSLRLAKHKLEGENFPLLRAEDGDRFLAQSGLTGAKGGGGFPYHGSQFVLQNPEAAGFAEGADSATVVFRAESGGVVLEKRYVFRRGAYLIDAQLAAKNTGEETVRPFGYFQLAHGGVPPKSHSSMLPVFFGAAVYTESDKFVKVPFDEIGEASYPRASEDGWIGFIQRYFAVAWLPQPGKHDFFMSKKNGVGKAGVIVPFAAINPGESQTVSARLFAGAQEQDILNRLHEEGIAPGIHLAVDYGWLTFIAVLLYKLLAVIFGFVGNWGAAVMLLTLAVKLLFYPLSAASYRSMAKMKAEAPRIKKLQERYASDKQKMQQEMMALYREKKINPLGGCLPILVQIPVFIALYWVLLGSVELRQAPFVLWIQDLSAPDPYYILPVAMGGAMYLQTLMSPAPPDPTQAMIMRGLPIFFAVFSIFFPSGLVVYWLSNTLLSIAQQWHITRSIEKERQKNNGGAR